MTWDEALNHIAEKMQAIKAEHGPEAMAMFSHGLGGTAFFKHTLRAYGHSQSGGARPTRSVVDPATSASDLTFGDEVASPERTDIANANCIVLIGSHLGENMHNTQVQEFAEAVGKRRLDHRGRSALLGRGQQGQALPADQAGHRHGAAAGLDERASSTEELYDRSTSRQHGFGFEAFAAEIARYTPEWAYPRPTIRARA